MKITLPVVGPDLPVHPYTGLTAIGLRRNGAPIWPVRGGAPDADDDEDGGDDDQDAGDDDQDDAGDDDQDSGKDQDKDKPLGRAGEQALSREKDKRRKAAAALRPWTTLARELGVSTPAEVKALVDRKAGDDKDADTERQRREAATAATDKANARIVRSEVKAAATGKLSDPKDALVHLDLGQFEVDDDGDVDEDAIAEAIDDLLKKKPYLAATPAKKRGQQKDASQGARNKATTSAADRASARLVRLGLKKPTSS
ncbi:hypothetical protein ABZS66_19185 [Dactylosporangium sp. NPDC005572]|uniref:hypothetical protein n=1 Tax=Dactylosporangium sp. NPDC005572 TaxID=3156889 RepID=UPI0033ABAF61